ncbi:MAG TPA: SAM-dependent methyltransferase [Polyangia bacterium]|nr:SAM-dependent methyltransferase [Polyangia bacterium]
MKEDRPSFTAAWVAACRGLGRLLPREALLADDPFGARFGGRAARLLERAGHRAPSLARATVELGGPLTRFILYMQVRTRLFDDVLRAFVREGGRQLVLLGAGFDCRAARFRGELDGANAVVFEIDHPATQARKRALLAGEPSARVEYLAWNFERGMDGLPAALAARGFDAASPALVIWEGVTPYLTEDAIEATVATVARLSARGSRLAFSYFDRELVTRPRAAERLVGGVVARVGEPFRFGWSPSALPAWLASRGFSLETDWPADRAAAELLPPRWARLVREASRHFAVARRS